MGKFSVDVDQIFGDAYTSGRSVAYDALSEPLSAVTGKNNIYPEAFAKAVQSGDMVSFFNYLKLNRNSALGTPVVLPIKLDGVLLSDVQVLMISGNKRIKKTPVLGAGKKGTVKELMGYSDFNLAIKGMVFGKNTYPSQAVKQLEKICNKQGTVTIESELTRIFGISEIVIERFQLGEDEGSWESQTFSISATSDEPIELLLST